MSFADNLKRLLAEKGVSQSELSRRTGINRPMISEYTHGRYEPKTDNLFKIAKALGVGITDLSEDCDLQMNNINITTNNGAVSGSGNVTYVKESHVTYGAVQSECMRLIEALFGDSPEALTYIKSLKISQSGKIEGLENIDVTSKALLDGARTTWIAALRNALEKGTDRVQIPV